MKKIRIYFLTMFFVCGTVLFSMPHRINQIPNGTINSCANCHVDPNGGARNSFGQLVEARFLNSNGDVVWGPEIAMIDSDGDGISKGDELQDRFGAWSIGISNPGNSSAVTLPGVSSSANLLSATINFSGMTPHQGQKLELRVIDKSTMKEVDRKTVASVTTDFAQQLDNLISGQSYFIDFYADINSNGIYDTPPTDHAWRISLDNVQGNDEINFSHNTNFTDIKWKYLLKINFASMAPHSNQLMELRVEDDNSSREIFRTRIENILQPDFNIEIPEVENGIEYNIEFYADLNGNGKYDAPPADHAWEIKVDAAQGNREINFTHNTEFTDINWKYLATINMIDMTPHLGQLIELRIVDRNSNEEIGRVKLDEILVPDFAVSVPQIEDGHNYNIDFYADLNNNKIYDTPPTDHAWRLELNNAAGNYITNFTHNTTFSDIQWPVPTNVENENLIPEKFALNQNYPNPFNPATAISYQLSAKSKVELKVFDILGKEISTLVNEIQSAGNYKLNFDASNLPSGIYVYQIKTENFIQSKKMILMK